jgi:hypothetical protein
MIPRVHRGARIHPAEFGQADRFIIPFEQDFSLIGTTAFG